MDDDELFRRLRASQPVFSFPADFQRGIWSRIHASERESMAGRCASLWARAMAWISQPLPAVAVAIFLGVCGCLLAAQQGRMQEQHRAQSLYVKAVSPFAAVKLSGR